MTIPQNSFQAYFLIQMYKATAIDKVLAEEVRKEIISHLEQSQFLHSFSACIQMKPPTLQCFSNCIHVTFLRLYSGKVRCIFLRLQPVQNADAESLLQALDRNLSDDGTVYYVNLVGLGSDGANVMLGTRNSVLIGLKAKQPALISFHCNCHLVALIVNRACKTLPDYLEDVTIQIWYFFQKSPKWY